MCYLDKFSRENKIWDKNQNFVNEILKSSLAFVLHTFEKPFQMRQAFSKKI